MSKNEAKSAQKKCFVIMPFSSTDSCSEGEWDDIFENTIKPAVEESGFDYECFRSNIPFGNIVENILSNLLNSEVVIADMTDRNPNVFYELGVRHTLSDVTILITQNIDDIPFDLRHYATIEYNWKTLKGRNQFKKIVRKVLIEIENEPPGLDLKSPVRKYLRELYSKASD